MAVGEAPLRKTKFGLCPDGEGWFIHNAREVRWRDYGPLGFGCSFEGKRPFKELGINLNVLAPGQSLGLYHRERHQEDFLVLAGECLLIVEGEARPLRAWDFFHCPGGTAHVIVGAGDGPAAVLAVGGRGGRAGLAYLVEPKAIELGAGVTTETTKPADAYASFPEPPGRRTATAGCPTSNASGRPEQFDSGRAGAAQPAHRRRRTDRAYLSEWVVQQQREQPWPYSSGIVPRG